jgi:AcrR family transcriptional regulator
MGNGAPVASKRRTKVAAVERPQRVASQPKGSLRATPAAEPGKTLTKAGRERKRDPERTSAAILAAAVHEFSLRGYEGARVDAIAKRAKINKRMLYHYFGGKDGLYLAVLEGRYAAIRSAETLLDLTHREPVEGMRNLIHFTWTYYLEHPEFLSILATENQHKARFLKQSNRIVQLNSPLIDALKDVLAHGAERKIFKPDVDPVQLYISIASLGAFYLSNRWTLSTIFRRDLASDAEVRGWGEHIADVILAFLRP